MDWSLFHAVNGLMRHGDGVQDVAETYNAVAIFAIVALAGLAWFVAQPYGPLRPKLAAVSAAFSAALGLLMNAIAGSLWFHPRPFAAHPHQTMLLVHHAADNSFPSDHTTVAFAVAFAVLTFHRRLGAVLVLGAVGVAVDRVLVGVHWPVDVAASAVIAAAAAAVVVTAGLRYVEWVVRVLSRVSDPVVAAARSALERR